MTSKIKVDNINKVSDDSNIISKCGSTVTVGSAPGNLRSGANNLQASDGGNLISQSGTTITLGAAGDTVTLAACASQTGFGQAVTGVEYCTTAKTGPLTAVSGKGYFINTSGGAVTVTLPSSPTAGDVVAINDYANTFATNAVTLDRNSSKIDGNCGNAVLNISGMTQTVVYVDGTKGWKSIQKAEGGAAVPGSFIVASGGTESTSGDYKIHKFTADGAFYVTSAGTPTTNKVDWVVVAGGGGGGPSQGGGGGAGGYRESHSSPVSGPYTASPKASANEITITAAGVGMPVTVGGGGAGKEVSSTPVATPGSPSSFGPIISTGGGGGAPSGGTAQPGGSGGGGGEGVNPGGSGNTPPVSPPQGFNGGGSTHVHGSGGGGATAVGANAGPNSPGNPAGRGGAGTSTSITASPVNYAGGGSGAAAGGGYSGVPAAGSPCGTGGSGGGGPSNTGGVSGTVNTGGGGGGGPPSSPSPVKNGSGGSGIVIIRYKYQ